MIPVERLQKSLERFFGLREFRPGQLEIISSVLNGFDTMVVMPTGGGKSICYQLPAILQDGLTVVVTPLISLMKDQVVQLNARASRGSLTNAGDQGAVEAPPLGPVATQLDSSLELDEIQRRLHLVRSGKVKLLYVAPERLESRRFTESLANVRISMIAVDEAHCVSQWGHDFRPHYTRISGFAESVGRPAILALTATATPDVQDDVVAQLRMRSPRVYVHGFRRDNLALRVLVETNKTQSVLNQVTGVTGPGIIYAATRKSVDEIHEFLNSKGVRAIRYHAGLTESERAESQNAFLNTDRVMVATNAFGMGIDKANVRYIVHYEIPGTLEAYYQEAGRAGRDGKVADCLLLFHRRDINIQEYFINGLYPEKDDFIKAYDALFDSQSIPIGTTSGEYISASSSEIAKRTSLPPRTIDSVIRILSQNGFIQILPSVSAVGRVRSSVDVGSYRRAIERTMSHDSRSVLEALLRLHGNAIFSSAKPVSLSDLALKSDIPASSVARTLSILHRSGIIEYNPPSEGVSFRMLKERQEATRLQIDFELLRRLRESAIARLRRMTEYAKTTTCRMNFILNYFGGDEIEDGCGNCDNCTTNREYFSAAAGGEPRPSPRDIHIRILSLVSKTGGGLGRSTYCKILLEGDKDGRLPAEMKDEFAGVFAGIPPQVVFSSFDFLLSRNFLARTGTLRPVVSVTEEGSAYLSAGFTKPRRENRVFRKALYRALREERRALAAGFKIPVFLVCTDDNLIAMSNERPDNAQALDKYLPEESQYKSRISDRLLQVCLDFRPAEDIPLSGDEKKVYELYLEGLTGAETASALKISVQEVIDVLEKLKNRGVPIDFRAVVEEKKFEMITRELKRTNDIVEARKNLEGCELSEVALVRRLISGDRS